MINTSLKKSVENSQFEYYLLSPIRYSTVVCKLDSIFVYLVRLDYHFVAVGAGILRELKNLVGRQVALGEQELVRTWAARMALLRVCWGWLQSHLSWFHFLG